MHETAAAAAQAQGQGHASSAAALAAKPATGPGPLARFGLFWYDFIVGDDWQVTLGVAVMLALVGVAHLWTGAWVIAGVFVLALIPFGTARAARA